LAGSPGGGAVRGAQQHVEVGLGEIGRSGIDGLDQPRGVDVDADHLDPPGWPRSQQSAGVITQTDYARRPEQVVHRIATLGTVAESARSFASDQTDLAAASASAMTERPPIMLNERYE
jgi:hypothetical protein